MIVCELQLIPQSLFPDLICLLVPKQDSPTSEGVHILYARMDLMQPFQLKSPFNAVVGGSSGSGKSHFVAKILKFNEELIFPPPERIYWCYSEWQKLYTDLSENVNLQGKLTFIKGTPTDDLFSLAEGHTLVVSDDLAGESSEELLNKIFTKKSHHTNTSIILCVQNIFLKHIRTATLNAHYLFIKKNPRDKNQITVLGSQILGKGKGKALVEAYEDATREPYSYICINLRQDADERGRIRANIFFRGKTSTFTSLHKAGWRSKEM